MSSFSQICFEDFAKQSANLSLAVLMCKCACQCVTFWVNVCCQVVKIMKKNWKFLVKWYKYSFLLLDLDLYFSRSNFLHFIYVKISQMVRYSKLRMAPLWMLYVVTLTYTFEVTILKCGYLENVESQLKMFKYDFHRCWYLGTLRMLYSTNLTYIFKFELFNWLFSLENAGNARITIIIR